MYLTKNDEDTLERIAEAKAGAIGEPCKRATKFNGGEAYKGPGMAEIKSSFKPYTKSPRNRLEQTTLFPT